MPEKTKEELSEELNKVLGTTVDFAKLSKDDLIALSEAIDKLRLPLPIIDRPLGEILNENVANRPLRDLTLADLLGLPKERKGLFGLGLIPRLRERLEEKTEEKKSVP